LSRHLTIPRGGPHTCATLSDVVRDQDREHARRFEAMCERLPTDALRPTLNRHRIALYVLAGLVHIATVACVVGAILIALSTLAIGLRILLPIILVWIAVTIRPRFAPLDPGVIPLSRAEAPDLYAVADQIAHALETPPAQALAVDGSVNSTVRRTGWRRRPTITIGLPLWWALGPAERVAVLGHELAHMRNGDLDMGIVVGGANRALDTWYYLLKPEARRAPLITVSSLDFSSNAARFVAPIFQVPLVAAINGYRRLMSFVDRTERQRSEYLADGLAARAAGREAMARALDALLCDEPIKWAVRRAAEDPSAEPWRIVAQEIASLSQEQRELRRDRASREFRRVRESHPPVHLRWSFVMSRPDEAPLVTLTTTQAAAIDRELAGCSEQLLDELRPRGMRRTRK
jgi:Zn-dependent protease with chaperone function